MSTFVVLVWVALVTLLWVGIVVGVWALVSASSEHSVGVSRTSVDE